MNQDPVPRSLRYLLLATGVLLVVAGMTTVAGWHLHSLRLIQPIPGWMPMQYNTALMSAVAGAGFLALALGGRSIPLFCGGVLALFGALTLIEHFVSIDLRIDVFVDSPAASGMPRIDRPAPNAALGFMLIGIALCVSAVRFALRPLVLGMLGPTVVLLALVTVFGYLIDAPRLYGWAYYTRMAPQVVVIFVLSGTVFAVLAARIARSEYGNAFSWLPLGAAIATMVASVVLWLALVQQENEVIERAVASEAERAKAELLWHFEPRILALKQMALRWHYFGRPRKEEWELDALFNVKHHRGFRSIQWVDGAFRVRWIVPLSGNAQLIGRTVASDAKQHRQLNQVRLHKVAALLYRPDGQHLLQAFVPVEDERGGFSGFIAGTFDVQQVLDDLMRPYFGDHGITVMVDDEPIYRRHADPAYEKLWGQEAVLDLHGLNLRLRVWPQYATLGNLRSPIPWMVLVSGFVLAILLLWALYLLETSRTRAAQIARVNRVLTDEIEVRRQAEAELSLSQARYRSLFDSIRDAIVVVDREERIVSCNPAFTHLFGYELEEVRGRRGDLMLHQPGEAKELERLSRETKEAPPVRIIAYRRKTGDVFAGETGLFSLRDTEDEVVGYIRLIRDVTERERTAQDRRRQGAYADLLHAVASAGNRAASIEDVAQTAIDGVCLLAGWPVGYLYVAGAEDGRLVPADVAHIRDAERFGKLRSALKECDVSLEQALPARALHSGHPEYVPDLASLPALPCRNAALAAGLRSASAFPVLVRTEIAAVLVFFSDEQQEPDAGVLDLLAQVATHLGRTLERVRAREKIERLNYELEHRVMERTRQLAEINAELEIEIAERGRLEHQLETALVQEREARLEAEGAHDRLAFLADATVKLSASLDYRVTLDTLAQLVVPYLADWCAIDAVQPDGSFALVAVAHVDPGMKQRIHDMAGLGAFSGAMACHSSAAAGTSCCRAQGCLTENRAINDLLEEIGCASCICVPLSTVERVVGVLTLVRARTGAGFTDADRHLAEDLARRAALAMDHAHLYRAAQEEIAERKRAEESLAAESGRLAVTLQSIGDGVITTDTEGRIVLINTVAEKLTGWPASEAIGRRLHEVFRFEVSDRDDGDRAQQIVQSGSRLDFGTQTVLLARDGTRRIIADSGAPIRDNCSNVIGAVLVFRDITERRRMEEDLIRAQKLESIGLLAGGIAHDFNNILTAILGNISLARMYCEEGSEVHEALSDAEKAFWRARALTQQLLTFARGGAPIRKTAPIGELVVDTVGFALRGTNTRCTFDIDRRLGIVSYDAGQISQVVNNLIINATQAMPQGGVITVVGRNVTLADHQVGALPAGDYVCISFIDQGSGIAEENLTRIFDPYFTTKPRGTGLGLATAYSIIRQHDGHIAVDSRPQEGSRFDVYLPISAEAAREERAPETIGAGGGQGRILIMDDERAVREVAVRLLRAIGYDVAEAECGGTAIELYRQGLETGRRFDAVILDLTVPGGLGGRECVQRLLEMDPGVRAIVSSGYSNDPVMAEYAVHGFHAVVCKPYRLRELAESLSRVLGEDAGAGATGTAGRRADGRGI